MHNYANEIMQRVFAAIYAIYKNIVQNIGTTIKQCYKEIRVSGFSFAYIEIKYYFDIFEIFHIREYENSIWNTTFYNT